ncbi:acetate kinase [Prosthecochloris sp. GSB1]|uniref:acetate/propionate family kinase n=1 Tax=Prosthecochloris sp. GSB1 TaxID=281093 RepID=UPI000B8CE564|nr:acetate/propionate family kinase [Prosthecochloris sp. GSB1]ASQ90846.1 acetate kinase [Prosthecochloris sp. GSB1]
MEKEFRILAVNTGSSSIKFSLYAFNEEEERLLATGSVTRVGYDGGVFSVYDAEGRAIVEEDTSLPDHESARKLVFSWLVSQEELPLPDALGHRIVHGGPDHAAPASVTPELLDDLEKLRPFAPEHLPQALDALRHAATLFSGIPQVACFDTAFHRFMPEVAQIYPLPSTIRLQGVRRYGFHGLSYEFILGELDALSCGQGRVVVAHLGHGASMAALRDGRSIDTTMGFSPAGGLVMSTRTGDLDPGVVLFLLQEGHATAGEIKEMVNRRSGLLGLSERSDDMRDLLAAGAAGDGPSQMAVDLFCYQARKQVGALAAVLGGLDTLVFTGGIGEHSPEIRSRICEGMGFLGIGIDEQENRAGGRLISNENSAVDVRVMKTNEEMTIARQTLRVIEGIQAT